MSNAKENVTEEIDREEWDRAWNSMPLRRLQSPTKLKIGDELLRGLGDPVSVMISEDPPQFSHKAWRESEACPVCGDTTSGSDRIPATLHPRWESGMRIGIGVWVHRACFERCPDADEPTPVPW